MPIEFPQTAHGVAVPLSVEDEQRDEHGFTNPNLHRRVDPQNPSSAEEVAPRQYVLGVYDGIHSFRTEIISTHDEESTTSEIP